VETLTERDADVIRTHHAGRERTYAGRAAACLIAAGRFREQIEFHETRLAERVTREPIEAAGEASGREGPPKRIAAETGLAETVASAEETGDVLRAHAGPTIAATRIASAPPPDAALVDRWEIDTGATVRLYEGAGPLRTYPPRPSARLDDEAVERLADAKDRLLDDPTGGDRAPGRAVRSIASAGDPVSTLVDVLRRHTRGYGAFEHVFADDRVSDATLSAPVAENPLRVVVDGERCRTNVRLPPEGAATLASRLRRTRAGEGSPEQVPRSTRRSRPKPVEFGSQRRRPPPATASRLRSAAVTRTRGPSRGSWMEGRSPAAAGAPFRGRQARRDWTRGRRPRRGEDDRAWVPPLGAASRDAIDIDRGYAGCRPPAVVTAAGRDPAAPSG